MVYFMAIDKLIELANNGYEDLSLSETKLIEFIKKYSSEFPLLIDGNEVWIHIQNNIPNDNILFETDIGENTKVIENE